MNQRIRIAEPTPPAPSAPPLAPGEDGRPLTPKAIVDELDRYIVGQRAAKRAVAIALRNRWRRRHVSGALRDEIIPRNIIMIGPTGVGKTEIARRLARLVQAPFVKVEASKFTEVGYVGRDVDAMVRDLVEVSVKLVRDEEQAKVRARAREVAEERLIDAMLSPEGRAPGERPQAAGLPRRPPGVDDAHVGINREALRELLHAGKLDDRELEIDMVDQAHPVVEIFSGAGLEQMGFDISQLQRALGGSERRRRRKMRVSEALEALAGEESSRLIDQERVQREAVQRAEQSGLIFLDEIDKITSRGATAGPDVSREGVQRDLLPLIEGSTVTTRYGPVRTDHILFIAAGAFSVSKPSDLIPELQGRFPIRVELEPLSEVDLLRILTEPEGSLLRQYDALLLTEGVRVAWQPGAVDEMARLAAQANERMENIGARRLQTVLERVLDELSFEAPELGSGGERVIPITPDYVRERVAAVLEDRDLSNYIL